MKGCKIPQSCYTIPPAFVFPSPRGDHLPLVNSAIKMQRAIWPLRLAPCAGRRKRSSAVQRVRALMEAQGIHNLVHE